MNNYLLSIDPSIKNTGFTLWENKKPILINSYSFKNYNYDWEKIQVQISYLIDMNEYDLLIERGTFHSKNGIGYETQEHLRGFIAGQFNKLLTKNMLISPSSWKKWYIDNNITNISLRNWNKKISKDICFYLNEKYEWNININNHDEADSLLIGWYYLNMENK
ncbi:MAG: hypothetical protein PPFGHCPK_01270 [Spiroplasma endosymbiont of Drosophila atripex]|nr:MAG: hypothetical protein PPFGHCPK_00319 [Spiroplasma endosymbiont of Drosophila atripex]WDA54800.1 MAG: hypothetical protein PPFGHCPK_01270 [Spiroplasma endosymbiont of Drosophila atripex]